MRVIAGKWKGLKLQTPVGYATRPTADRVREGIFSILGSEIQNTHFLDLFAGTGSVGLEALSRGAKFVIFVEKNNIALKCLKNNIQKIGATQGCQIIRADGFAAHRMLIKRNMQFDIIYMDPPFFLQDFWGNIEQYFSNPLVSENGALILEHFHKSETPENFGKLHRTRQVFYGDSGLSIYRSSTTV